MSGADMHDRAGEVRTRRIPSEHARVVLAQRTILDRAGTRCYFCGPGCLATFAADHADHPPT